MGGQRRKLYREDRGLISSRETLDDLLKIISVWKQEHPDALEPHFGCCDVGDGEVECNICYWTYETDEEIKERVALAKKNKLDQEKADFKQYERLKKRFENKNK